MRAEAASQVSGEAEAEGQGRVVKNLSCLGGGAPCWRKSGRCEGVSCGAKAQLCSAKQRTLEICRRANRPASAVLQPFAGSGGSPAISSKEEGRKRDRDGLDLFASSFITSLSRLSIPKLRTPQRGSALLHLRLAYSSSSPGPLSFNALPSPARLPRPTT